MEMGSYETCGDVIVLKDGKWVLNHDDVLPSFRERHEHKPTFDSIKFFEEKEYGVLFMVAFQSNINFAEMLRDAPLTQKDAWNNLFEGTYLFDGITLKDLIERTNSNGEFNVKLVNGYVKEL
jgi:hypothetical protein